ncbi:MAG TPA: glycosyltransferase family 9 protein [Pyrinomonadaceae bacterium]|nr:glycosyltransferase family 9 protein [Pyrinomonadaceae bacterium]
MNSLRHIVEESPVLRAIETTASQSALGENLAQPLGPARWDWNDVQRILLIRLRSIGDTVLATPSAAALKRFVPNAEIDLLVEDWVAPLLDEHPHLDRVLKVPRRGISSRARIARELRTRRYDVVYNLHGGTTATFLTRATGARHRVGYKTYQYAQLHNHQAPSPLELWCQQQTHSVEQQLALLGWTGVPVTDRPRTLLGISNDTSAGIQQRLDKARISGPIALIHPAAAFATKQWKTENFAEIVDYLTGKGFSCVAVAAPSEGQILQHLAANTKSTFAAFDDLRLPEITALASRSKLFVGNDSGIAHIAAAVGTPAVVIFGSSNIAHWRPWNRAPAEIVYEQLPCQPCHGYFCEKFPAPECILRVPVDRVAGAIDRVLNSSQSQP